MVTLRIMGVDFVPLMFVVGMQQLHEREIAAQSAAYQETTRQLMWERKKLLAELEQHRRYTGGESRITD